MKTTMRHFYYALTLGASLLGMPTVQAQSNSCDQLKQVLAERMDPAIKGYSMETAPANAPVPPRAKVIGTCEGGASKILYYRFGAPQAPVDSATTTPTTTPTSAPPTVTTVSPPNPTAPVNAPASSPQVPPAPAQAVAPPPPPKPIPAPTPLVATPPPKLEVPADKPVIEKQPAPSPKEAPAIADSPAPKVSAAAAATPTEKSATGSWMGLKNWQWIALIALLALGASVWVWRTYFSAYDSAGLPRGPKL